MKHMKRLAQERHIPLDLKYWEHITRSILAQPDTDIAVICPSPAGSGKSTWILSFSLAIEELFSSTSELESSLVGIVVVLQKVEDMNVSKSSMEKPWKLPALAEYTAELIEKSDKTVFLCTYQKVSAELAERLSEYLPEPDFRRVLLMPDREPPTLPYFNGTNGSNAFKEAELVMVLGYPRLDPATYLSFACAACGMETIAAELDAVPEEKLLARNMNILDLPSVNAYISHHLAARLEQEIYRCAQRNPGFTGEITLHLFCPPIDVLNILRERISGEIIYDDMLSECVARWKGAMRQHQGSNTSFGQIVPFLDEWDGSPLRVTELRERLGISPAVWKDLISEDRVKSLLEQRGIRRIGRGPNAQWCGYNSDKDCA